MVKNLIGSSMMVLPKGSQVMMYKGEVKEKLPIDALLHAVSYICIANTYVDVGNYETKFNYFPVHFSGDLPTFPDPETIAYTPSEIRWKDFPSVGYIFGLDADREDRLKLADFFHIVREEGSLSVWQRNSLI